ncbi:YkgJ family cysteine cluster protein [Desulfobotulus mexicanus]|nr:YkgJ family cysteine cluster protein [Desulfobotulus mexicanus]
MGFWKNKKLEEMSMEEWESLCDGCGRCCLVKMEEEETSLIYYTRLACEFLDLESGECRIYNERFSNKTECLAIRDCLKNNPDWLPVSCAYRCLNEGRDLPSWHPLMQAPGVRLPRGIGVGDWAFSVRDMDLYSLDLEAHLISFEGVDGSEVRLLEEDDDEI